MANSASDFSGSPVFSESTPGGALVAVSRGGLPMMAGNGGSAGPEILVGGFNSTWLANCLRRRWLSALLLGGLAAAGAGLLLLWLFPETASTVAYLKLNFRDNSMAFRDKSQQLSPAEIERESNSQLALIKSEFVLESALGKSEIGRLQAVRDQGQDAVLWLSEDLQASFPSDGSVLELRYDGEEDPQEMEQVVQAVVESYTDIAVKQEKEKQIAAHEAMSNTLRLQLEHLQELREEYQRLADVKGGVHSATAGVETVKLTRELTEITREISKIKSDILDVDVYRQVAINTADNPLAMEVGVQEAMKDDPMIKDYQDQLYALQQQYMDRKSRSRNPASRELALLRDQMQQLQDTIKGYQDNKQRELRAELKRTPNYTLSTVNTEWRVRRGNLENTLKELNDSVKEKESRLLALGARDAVLDLKLSQIEDLGKVTSDLSLKVQGWKIDEESIMERIVVLNKATSKPTPSVQRWTVIGVGSLAALTLMGYGVALLDFRRRRLNSPSDLDEGLGIRVLGALPSATPRKTLGVGTTSAVVAEAMDSARAAIIHGSGGGTQVLLVVSPDTMEGASTVAINLARSLARAGRRTLLVDGDIRSPSIHSLLGLPLGPGLSEVLRAEEDVADLVQSTQEPGFYVLTAGDGDQEAVRVLATDQPEAVIDQLRAQFDHIIIDGAPLLSVGDSLALGRLADGAILAVLRDQSEIRHILKVAENLQSVGIRLLGAIVNGVPMKPDARVKRLHAGTASKQRKLTAKPATPRTDASSDGTKSAAKSEVSAAPTTATPPAAPSPPLDEPFPRELPPAIKDDIKLASDIDIDLDDLDFEN